MHARAGRHLRSVKARIPRAARQDATHEEPGIVEAIAAETASLAAEPASEEHSQVQPSEPTAPNRRHDTEPTWDALYDRLERDWNELVTVANHSDLPLPLVRGYDELIGRVQDLANHPELPSTEREELAGLLDYHRSDTAARQAVHDYLEAAERHVKACEPLQREAETLDVHIADVAGWSMWRQEAQQLERAGRAILADDDTYGAYLDAVAAGKPHARWAVDQLRSRIEDGRVQAGKSGKPEQRHDPVQNPADLTGNPA